MKYKLLILLAIISLFTGCNLLNQPQSNSNKPANNSNNSNKPAETPASTPKVETNQNSTTNDAKNVSENKSVDNTPKGKLDDKINQANYDKINDGMSLNEVAAIFSDGGMQIADMTVNGRHSIMFMWSIGDMKKKIKVTFEKDKVVEKEKDGF